MAKRVLHDHWFKKAKAEGYVARSAYKLSQIQDARRILNPGETMLDLGCAPGAWLQVGAKIVGPHGTVVGIDLKEVRHDFGDNVYAFAGDAFEADPEMLMDPIGGERFDVVVSDMAPNTVGFGDAERSISMCQDILDVLLPKLLKRGGNFAMKVFEGGGYAELLKASDRIFGESKGFKPRASRDVSREMYIVGKFYKGHNPKEVEAREAKKRLPPHLRFTEDELRNG